MSEEEEKEEVVVVVVVVVRKLVRACVRAYVHCTSSSVRTSSSLVCVSVAGQARHRSYMKREKKRKPTKRTETAAVELV